MVNESELPQFQAGPLTPIGQISGMPVAPKKAASGLLKRIMAFSKSTPKVKAKIRKPTSGRRGIEGNSKVHIGHKKVRFY